MQAKSRPKRREPKAYVVLEELCLKQDQTTAPRHERWFQVEGSISTRSFVGLDPWGLDPGAWKKPKLSKSEVNLKKVEKIHEKSKPVCEQSNR